MQEIERKLEQIKQLTERKDAIDGELSRIEKALSASAGITVVEFIDYGSQRFTFHTIAGDVTEKLLLTLQTHYTEERAAVMEQAQTLMK